MDERETEKQMREMELRASIKKQEQMLSDIYGGATAQALEKIGEGLNRYLKHMEAQLGDTGYVKIYSRTREITNITTEIVTFLTECIVNDIEVDTTRLNSINFIPYSFNQLEKDCKKYINLAKNVKDLAEFTKQRIEFLKGIPSFVLENYPQLFRDHMNYELKNSSGRWVDWDYGVTNKDEIPYNGRVYLGYAYFPSDNLKKKLLRVNINGNLWPIDVYFDENTNFSMRHELIGDRCVRFREINNRDANWLETDILYKELQEELKKYEGLKIETQYLYPATELEKANNKFIYAKDFEVKFIGDYIYYLEGVFAEYSRALLEMKTQYYKAYQAKANNKKEQERLKTMDVLVNPNNYTDEEIIKLVRKHN